MNKYIVGAVLLTALAVGRVAATYGTFNSTSDEPAHIACGMEWLQFGTYTYEYQHPPLARIAVALGPFLKGVRSAAKKTPEQDSNVFIFEDGNRLLYSGGDYWTNLTLARLGVLPFLILICGVTFAWARRWFGDVAAIWCLMLLVCTPALLGHAGLATLDVACAATTVAALYLFVRWMEEPTMRRALWMGVAVAVAFLSKFSSVVFLGACFPVGLVYVMFVAPEKRAVGARVRQIGVAVLVAFLLMWGCYRFTVQPLKAEYGASPRVDQFLRNKPLLRSAWDLGLKTPLPLTELMLGVRDLNRHDAIGHDSYLLGKWRNTGWWYFFPVVLAVKTPVGLLLLAVVGLGAVLIRFRTVPWQHVLPALFAVMILLVCMVSHIDLGVRHILSIYPLLAILGGAVVARAVRWRTFAVICALWVAGQSIRAHPDYMAYFNEFVGGHPEKILAESDLDWGQDLHRLSERLKTLGIDKVSIGYFGSASLEHAGLPPYQGVPADRPVTGYVAVSVRRTNIDFAKDGSFGWLKKYKPLERIGKSIDLYWIQP